MNSKINYLEKSFLRSLIYLRKHNLNYLHIPHPFLEKKWQLTLLFLPGKSHGQRNLAGYSSWDCKELDMTKHIYTNILIKFCLANNVKD